MWPQFGHLTAAKKRPHFGQNFAFGATSEPQPSQKYLARFASAIIQFPNCLLYSRKSAKFHRADEHSKCNVFVP